MPVAAAAATVASAAIGASSASKAAKKSAQAVTDASAEATALDREIYYDQRSLLEPSITAGADARARQMLMTGSTPEQVKAYLASVGAAVGQTGGAGASASTDELRARYPDLYSEWSDPGSDGVAGNMNRTPNFADFASARGMDIAATPAPGSGSDYSWVDEWSPEEWLRSTPGYQFNFDEGQRAAERGAAARGDLYSGGFARELTRYGQNYADNEWDDLWGQFGQLAGDGAQATGDTVQVAGQYGQNVTGNIMTAGNARASGYEQAGNAWGNFWQGAAGVPMYAYGQGWGRGK